MRRIKHVASLTAGGTPTVDEPSYWDDSGLPWIAIGDMVDGGSTVAGSRGLTVEGMRAARLAPGRRGTTLFAMYASVGAVSELSVDACWNQAILGIAAVPHMADDRFIRYWLMGQRPHLASLLRSNTQDNLNAEQVGNLPFSEISLEVQRKIADLLDVETGRIDALIENKHRLIALTKERQQSLVDDVLAPFPVEPLKHSVSIATSNVDKLTVDGQPAVRLCNYTNVYYEREITLELEFMVATATPEQIVQFELRAGDVLITKDSETADDIAVPSLVRDDLPGVVCGYHLALLRPVANRADGAYLYWALRSEIVRQQFSIAATGVTRFGLRRDAIGATAVPLPEIDVQRRVAARLEASQREIDRLTVALRQQIGLLREHRQALITAAVTGQLDVAKAAA